MRNDTHPQYDPAIQRLRTSPTVLSIDWVRDERYKVTFRAAAATGDPIEKFVTQLDESSFGEVGGPASRSGASILIQREETTIEITESEEEVGSDIMNETQEPPTERLTTQLEHLREITESTVGVDYHGGSVFILTARDNEFWNSVFRSLREHDFQIQKQLDGKLYVEKQPR